MLIYKNMTVQLKKKLIMVSQKYQQKRVLFQYELQSITELLNQGIGTSLSEIGDIILVEFLSDKIQFCIPCQANQSLTVFRQT